MLFETIGQGWIFLLMLYIGFCCGLFDEFLRAMPSIRQFFKNKKIKLKEEKNNKKLNQNNENILKNKTDLNADLSSNKLDNISTPPLKIEFNKQNNSPQRTPKKQSKGKIFTKELKHIIKEVSTWIKDVLRILIYGAVYYLSNLTINFGEMRLYTIIAFIGGFLLIRTIFAFVLKMLKKHGKLNTR